MVTYCTALLNITIMLFAHRLPLLCLVSVTLFNCSVGRQDCSRCRTADPKYGCVWCGGAAGSRCVYQDSCNDEVQHTCPAPVIHFVRGYFFLLAFCWGFTPFAFCYYYPSGSSLISQAINQTPRFIGSCDCTIPRSVDTHYCDTDIFSEAPCHKGMMDISHIWSSCVSAGPSVWSC